MNTSALPMTLVQALHTADVSDEALHLCAEAASWATGLSDDDRRAWALLVLATLEGQRRGDTRLPLPQRAPTNNAGSDDGFLPTLLTSMGIPADECGPVLRLAARLQTTPALAALVGAPGEFKPFIVDDGFLYHQRVFAVEQRLAQALRRRLEGPPPPLSPTDLERALAAAAESSGTPLSDEQRAAVTAALSRPLAVITGGPGTGKTSVIVALLRAATALGIESADVALAAPTGKAAHRINETLAARPVGSVAGAVVGAPSAETVHRLLGYRASGASGVSAASGEFRHHRNHRLPHRLVIVDESSMIDLRLMERLAGAVRDDARLVLLGDAYQLPSVDAGAVFRDLTTAPWAVTLTRSYRMDPATGAGRAILAAAEAIRTDRAADLAVPQRRRAAELTFEGIEQLVGGTLEDFFARWMARASSRSGDQARLSRRVYHFDDSGPAAADARDLAALYAHQHDQRILCATRGPARPTGADAVNATLHRRAAAHHQQAAGGFAVGEPLIMLRNDYQRGLFNGDLGICAQVVFGDGAPVAVDETAAETVDDSTATLAAVFARGDSFVAFPLSHLAPDLALAYALTVHRAQGSEVDALALILPDEDLPLLSRELLYTALTRARRSAVIVGAPRILEQGVARQIHRSSGLAERLFSS